MKARFTFGVVPVDLTLDQATPNNVFLPFKHIGCSAFDFCKMPTSTADAWWLETKEGVIDLIRMFGQGPSNLLRFPQHVVEECSTDQRMVRIIVIELAHTVVGELRKSI